MFPNNLRIPETAKLVTEISPQRLAAESTLQPTKNAPFSRNDSMTQPGLSSGCVRDASGSTVPATDLTDHKDNQETIKIPEDVRVTTADIEQAAHLSAQFQHVAYIQRFFSPLLESVGLSAKVGRKYPLSLPNLHFKHGAFLTVSHVFSHLCRVFVALL